MCCYTTWCHWCAIADLSVLMDGFLMKDPETRWWVIILCFVLLNFLITFLAFFMHYYAAVLAPMHTFFLIMEGFVLIYIAWASSREIAKKLDFDFDPCSCSCCLQYWLCYPCKVCQIANQLSEDKKGIQCNKTVELVTYMNQCVPLKNVLAKVKPKKTQIVVL